MGVAQYRLIESLPKRLQLRALTSANVLSADVVADLQTVSAVLNSAVHGKEIKAEDAQAALQLGNSVLSRLEGNG
jgi:hypothetical protein